MFLSSRGKWLAVIVFFLIVVVPIPKVLIEEWSVRIVDEHGVPISGIRVLESWENYTFRVSGGAEKTTDSEGTVIFQRQRQFAPLLYWVAKSVSNIVGFGVHASFGTFGRVWTIDESLERLPPTNQHQLPVADASCFDESCTSARLQSEFQLLKRWR